MRRLILTAIAAATVLSPMAVAGAASAQGYDRHDNRDNDRRGGNDHRGDNNRGDRGRDDRRDHRDDRWDDHRHNGYYYNNHWNYGPPPAAYYGRPGFRLGYTGWNRGGYLPPVWRNSYVVRDYGRYGLHRPPRGYAWHRVGDDYVLAALATGLILEVMAHH